MTEYLAENSRLRQLSRRYAENQLAYDDYRLARREILEALEAGQTQSAALPPLEETAPAAVFSPDATGLRLPDDSAVFYKTMPPRVPAQAEVTATATPTATPVLPADAALDGFDGNAKVLAVVLVAAVLIALTALIYVFIL